MNNITTTSETLFPIYEYNFLMYLFVSIVSIFCSMAGVGGGGILTPIFFILGNYSLYYAIPLSMISIMGSSLSRYLILLPKKHTLNNNIPLIDYGILIQMIPFGAAGSYVGVYFNSLLNESQLKYIVIGLFSLISIKTYYKTYKIYKKESKLRNTTNTIYIDGICVPLENNITSELIETGNINIIKIISSILLYLTIFALFGIWKIFNKYWYIGFLQFIYSLSVGFVCILLNNKYKFSPNIESTYRKSSIFALTSFSVGTLSTMLGIGGGMIYSIVLLQMKVSPEIVMATNSVATLTGSIVSSIQYISDNRLYIQIGGFCFVISSLSGYVGLKCYKNFKKRCNKQSIIVFILSNLMVLAVILVSIK